MRCKYAKTEYRSPGGRPQGPTLQRRCMQRLCSRRRRWVTGVAAVASCRGRLPRRPPPHAPLPLRPGVGARAAVQTPCRAAPTPPRLTRPCLSARAWEPGLLLLHPAGAAPTPPRLTRPCSSPRAWEPGLLLLHPAGAAPTPPRLTRPCLSARAWEPGLLLLHPAGAAPTPPRVTRPCSSPRAWEPGLVLIRVQWKRHA